MLFQKISVQQESEEQKSLIHWGQSVQYRLMPVWINIIFYADLSLEVFAIALTKLVWIWVFSTTEK